MRADVAALRDTDCARPTCARRAEQHDPEMLLLRHLGKAAFRDRPAALDGLSLQPTAYPPAARAAEPARAACRALTVDRKADRRLARLGALEGVRSDRRGSPSQRRRAACAGLAAAHALHEGAFEMRRVGRPEALRLATAHAAQELEFNYVIVLDASHEDWSREKHRRLLYVAMTRASETLTLLGSDAGRSVPFTDFSGSSSVHQIGPDFLPSPRADVERCQQGLMPRNVDLGWAGMFGTPHEAPAASKSCGWAMGCGSSIARP